MGEYIPFFVIGGIIIIALIAYFFSQRKNVLRALKKVKAIQINRAQSGEYVKLFGKAQSGTEPLIAPLTGRHCVYYRVRVRKKSGNKNNSWRTIIDDQSVQDFMLEQRGESAIIKTDNFKDVNKSYIVYDKNFTSGTFNDAKVHLERYLEKHGEKSTGFFGLNKTMKYEESVIHVGENIAVMGIAQWKSIDQPIEGYNYSKILQLSGDLKNKLVITDDPEGLVDKVR